MPYGCQPSRNDTLNKVDYEGVYAFQSTFELTEYYPCGQGIEASPELFRKLTKLRWVRNDDGDLSKMFIFAKPFDHRPSRPYRF